MSDYETTPRYFTKPSGKGKTRRTENMKRLWADPEFRARRVAMSKAQMARLNADPEFRAKVDAAASAMMSARWADPVQRERMVAVNRLNLAAKKALREANEGESDDAAGS